MSEIIRTAYNDYVEASPTMFVDAIDLRIGDIILPVDNGNGTMRYPAFLLPNGDLAVFEDDFEGCMTVTGIEVDDNDDVTIWAVLVWYGEPTEDNAGSFVYRRECEAFTVHDLPYEIMRR